MTEETLLAFIHKIIANSPNTVVADDRLAELRRILSLQPETQDKVELVSQAIGSYTELSPITDRPLQADILSDAHKQAQVRREKERRLREMEALWRGRC